MPNRLSERTFILAVFMLSLSTSFAFAADTQDNEPPELVGKVLGRPIYRSDIEASSRSEFRENVDTVFLQPIWRHYRMEHWNEVEPSQEALIRIAAKLNEESDELEELDEFTEPVLPETPEEILEIAREDIAGLEAYIEKLSNLKPLQLQFERIDITPEDIEEMKAELKKMKSMTDAELVESIRESYKSPEQLLADEIQRLTKLSDEEKAREGVDEAMIETHKRQLEILRMEQKHPMYSAAHLLYGNWKFEKHLHETFGGGRVVWQQSGIEAFDAARKFVEEQEKAGKIEVYDPQVREAIYHYWNHSLPPIVYDSFEKAAAEFLKPEWLTELENAKAIERTVTR